MTFYTLISIVPIVALIFAVLKGFGMTEDLVQNLYGLLPQMPEVVDYVVDFAQNTLAEDETAIARLLIGMKGYVDGGEEIYPLADALQDAYLTTLLKAAIETGEMQSAKSQIWAE